MDGDCCRLRDQRHFLDGDGTKLAVNWTDEAHHATLSWGDWFLGMLPLSILLVLLVPWLAYVLYPPVLKSGDQVPRWAETELQAMVPALFA